MSYASSDLVYDEASHTSTLPDGSHVPHVTAVLTAVGVSTNFEELAAMSRRTAFNVRLAQHRGSAIHMDCHAYDDGDLDLADVDYRVRPAVEAWAECRARLGLTPIVRERRVYHPLYNYTGFTDGVFVQHFGTGPCVLLDIKNGDPHDAAAHLQTAAYEGAWLAEHPDQPVNERWAVWLQPGRRVPYEIINYTARPDADMDFDRFLACLTTYWEQPDRRRRIR